MGLFKSKEELLEQSKKEAEAFLVTGEQLEEIHHLLEDFIAFTSKRVIFVDKNFASSKKGISSIPYSKITSLGLAKGGFMSFSQEIEIRVGSASYEIKVFEPGKVMAIYKKLSEKIM